jgi:hypothetical protein
MKKWILFGTNYKRAFRFNAFADSFPQRIYRLMQKHGSCIDKHLNTVGGPLIARGLRHNRILGLLV